MKPNNIMYNLWPVQQEIARIQARASFAESEVRRFDNMISEMKKQFENKIKQLEDEITSLRNEINLLSNNSDNVGWKTKGKRN